MHLKLVINLDNAAFAGDALPGEVARILRETAGDMVDNGVRPPRFLRDINGNQIGHAVVLDDHGEEVEPCDL